MASDQDEPPPRALTKNPLGPSGRAVAKNVERLRDKQKLTFAALSERLGELGRPIPPLGLRKIVAETRRVDADDLVALAIAFGVTPISLLMPDLDHAEEDDLVEITGCRDKKVAAKRLWDWLRASQTLGSSYQDMNSYIEFLLASEPRWIRRRREELFANEARRAQRNLAESGWIDEDEVPDGDDQ